MKNLTLQDKQENLSNAVITFFVETVLYSTYSLFVLFLLCLGMNGALILNICIRPSLWTIKNTFLVLFLAIGMVYGCIRFILTLLTLHVVGINEDPNFFIDHNDLWKPPVSFGFQICLICSSSTQIYAQLTTFILVGAIFISSVLSKFGGDFKEGKNTKKPEDQHKILGYKKVSIFIWISALELFMSMLSVVKKVFSFLIINGHRKYTRIRAFEF